MSDHVILLSIPGLEAQHLAAMPHLRRLTQGGDHTPLSPSFPAVTCPVQANMTTGLPPSEHGVVANGFFWRDRHEVEMWTAWNDCIQRPQLWDLLHEHDPAITSAVWFPLHSKGCGADYICTFAPIHNPDGSESLWCYTRPEMMYGDLRDTLGHFPLKHFWGPLAGIQSSAWIVSSAIWAAEQYHPRFWYIYLPHLDYAGQKFGPQSAEATAGAATLDAELGRLITAFQNIYADQSLLWLAASEYTITPVKHVCYPNRILRELGTLDITEQQGEEQLDLATSTAWALADHQLSHIFLRDPDSSTSQSLLGKIVDRFRREPGVAEVLTRDQLDRYELDHPRAGEIVVISKPESWQAYYWWTDDSRTPSFARKMDIHRKPGYDPVELFFDPVTQGISLDASLVRGSHGAPPRQESQQGVLLASEKGIFVERTVADTDVAGIVLRQFSAG